MKKVHKEIHAIHQLNNVTTTVKNHVKCPHEKQWSKGLLSKKRSRHETVPAP
jgi:hypothetical protein